MAEISRFFPIFRVHWLVFAVLLLPGCFGTFAEPVIGAGNRTTISENRNLRAEDQRFADLTLANLLETAPDGGVSNWRSSTNLTFGAYRVTDTYRDTFKRVCRDYDELVNVSGTQEVDKASACRDLETGQWKRVYFPTRVFEGFQ